ncbi:unnamed protein product [Phytomonas sp. EM1]|nr:unnamed protein product [Phytomonas sp. EM1]|eukprot:CCW64414.1 unnamed protein product [Phytomonas sp. isolate EM1]
MSNEEKGGEKHEESDLSYSTGWVANGLSWSPSDDVPFCFAVSSYIQSYKNYVDVVEKDDGGRLVCRARWEHCYPPTKTMFSPKRMSGEFIITTADYLRLWEITPSEAGDGAARGPGEDPARKGRGGKERGGDGGGGEVLRSKVAIKRVFDNGKPNDFCSPVTSCDWSAEELGTVACSSIDATVTIWDLERGVQKTKLMAHDKDVYDVAFASAHTFASCGADGSVRFFDLREMDHSTILYETPALHPLLRVAWNQQDANYISTFGIDGLHAVVIDVRYPTVPASLLSSRHQLPINGMAWSPQSAQNICTVGEDGVVCIWSANGEVGVSLFQYTCGVPINNVAWRNTNKEDWIAITTGEGAKVLRL